MVYVSAGFRLAVDIMETWRYLRAEGLAPPLPRIPPCTTHLFQDPHELVSWVNEF